MIPDSSFAYEAQTPQGLAVRGSIEAQSFDNARWKLQGMGLIVTSLEAAAPPAPPRGKPLGAEDFAAFNEQLALLTRSQLPLEQGLKLIADDMRSGPMAATVRELAAKLEAGTPLPEAFDEMRGRFPPVYARLMEVGLATGDLSGVLLNLSEHLAMTQRLRAALWRAVSYPLMVFVALGLVMVFLGVFITPGFEALFAEWDIELPVPTEWVIGFWKFVPVTAGVLIAAMLALPLTWAALKAAGHEAWLTEHVVLRLPLLGRVVRRNIAARWCHLMEICVRAGVTLTQAIALASDAIDLRGARADGAMIEAAMVERAADEAGLRLSVLPGMIAIAMRTGIARGDLPGTLAGLGRMYERQAERGLGSLQAVLPPVLLIGVGILVLLTLLGLFIPLVRLLYVMM
ncbi:MAG: hypothetical protein GC162_20220 [Planctomycetes bacterium]|nr:hypothetical protein [Planctomycetota bacterium]